MRESLNCMVISDSNVPKTELLIKGAGIKTNDNYKEKVFDNSLISFSCTNGANKDQFSVTLFDTSGQEEYSKIRRSNYHNINVFILAFNIDDMSLYSIRDIWAPDIKQYCPWVPFVIVGIGSQNSVRTTNSQQAEDMAKELGAANYLECDMQNSAHVKKVFAESAEIGLNHFINTAKAQSHTSQKWNVIGNTTDNTRITTLLSLLRENGGERTNFLAATTVLKGYGHGAAETDFKDMPPEVMFEIISCLIAKNNNLDVGTVDKISSLLVGQSQDDQFSLKKLMQHLLNEPEETKSADKLISDWEINRKERVGDLQDSEPCVASTSSCAGEAPAAVNNLL